MKTIFSRKNIFTSLLLLIFLIPILLPLFQSGMFISDDGGWMIVRLSDFHQSLKDGQFPVRWGSRLNHGFGYPVFNFLYPGVLYLGEMIHLLGFNFTDSIKILFGLGMLYSAFFSYLWLKTKFKTFPALIGSFVYLYAPYHLFDLYKRGSLGEIVALGIVPTIFYFLEKNNRLLFGLSIGLLILSHNTLSLLFLPIIIIYTLIPPLSAEALAKADISRNSLKQNLIPLLLGVLTSSFFFIPALYDRQFTIFDSVAVSNWPEYFLTSKNFYLLGWGSIIIITLSVIKFITTNRHCEPVPTGTGEAICSRKLPLFFILFSLLSILLSSSVSTILWQILPLPKIVQFPWRFLALTILGVSYLSAWLVSYSGKVRFLVGAVIIVLFLSNLLVHRSFSEGGSHLNNLRFLAAPDSYFTTNEDSTTVKNEYLPLWAKQEPPTVRAEKLYEVYSGNANIQIIKNKSNHIILQTNLKKPANIKINKLYFPGWNLKINDQKVNLYSPYYQLSSVPKSDGLIRIPLLPTTNKIELYWSETPLRLNSDIISLGSLFGLLYFSIKTKKL